MITTIGVSYILFNVVLLTIGADAFNFPNPMPMVRWGEAGVVLQLREVLVWVVAIMLMGCLHFFVRHTKMGKAMQATAQDQEAARMMGVEVDRVVMITFFLGSALAGAAGMIFGLYYNYTNFVDRLYRRLARLYRGRAGRHREHPRRDDRRGHHRSHRIARRAAPRGRVGPT